MKAGDVFIFPPSSVFSALLWLYHQSRVTEERPAQNHLPDRCTQIAPFACCTASPTPDPAQPPDSTPQAPTPDPNSPASASPLQHRCRTATLIEHERVRQRVVRRVDVIRVPAAPLRHHRRCRVRQIGRIGRVEQAVKRPRRRPAVPETGQPHPPLSVSSTVCRAAATSPSSRYAVVTCHAVGSVAARAPLALLKPSSAASRIDWSLCPAYASVLAITLSSSADVRTGKRPMGASGTPSPSTST